VAQVIVAADLPSYEGASFHAQQAVEKALKALLTRHRVEFRSTHDLGELRELAEPVAPGARATLAGVEVLTPHAVETRYLLAEVSREEAARHVQKASATLDQVRSLLRDYLEAGRPA
jgi:HEPN domain-containing protein